MNSSNKKSDNTLAAFTPVKLQVFLSEIANLNDSPESAARIARRFAEFELFTVPFRAFGPAPGHEKDEERKWLLLLRDVFRAIWLERDSRRRDWNGAAFRVYLAQPPLEQVKGRLNVDPMAVILPEPLPESPLERALDFLLKWHYKARYCGNPDCPAHYFFGTRTNQQFCSLSCAEHGQREAKRRWWEAHGDQWRTEQKRRRPAKKQTRKRR
jgi:hypothetical protein